MWNLKVWFILGTFQNWKRTYSYRWHIIHRKKTRYPLLEIPIIKNLIAIITIMSSIFFYWFHLYRWINCRLIILLRRCLCICIKHTDYVHKNKSNKWYKCLLYNLFYSIPEYYLNIINFMIFIGYVFSKRRIGYVFSRVRFLLGTFSPALNKTPNNNNFKNPQQ